MLFNSPLNPFGCSAAGALLNVSPRAIFLLDDQARLLHRNHAADLLLQRADSLILHEHTIEPAHRSMREPFRRFLQSIGGSAGSRSSPIAIEKISDGRPLQVMATSMEIREFRTLHVVLVANDPDLPTICSKEVLMGYFSFTSAEVEIANKLLNGYSIYEIAEERSVSSGTVRNQMKSIFAKTKLQRQVDLVKLLLTVPTSPHME